MAYVVLCVLEKFYVSRLARMVEDTFPLLCYCEVSQHDNSVKLNRDGTGLILQFIG